MRRWLAAIIVAAGSLTATFAEDPAEQVHQAALGWMPVHSYGIYLIENCGKKGSPAVGDVAISADTPTVGVISCKALRNMLLGKYAAAWVNSR